MRRYESDRPNAGFMVGYHYLPELFPELNHRWKKLDTSDLSDLFASLPTPVHNDAQLTSEERAESHRTFDGKLAQHNSKAQTKVAI